jgi:asparagine synthase (glutamine-hydrolysing)
MGALAIALLRGRPAGHDVIERMLGVVPHRGDDTGHLVHGDAAFGVRTHPGRADASLARQDGVIAVIAGDLANEADLRRELASTDVPPPPEGAAHTVIAAFAAWGDDAPARMRGSFAGAVSDGRGVRVFRDQFGFQTVFVRDDDQAFLAASEAKQIVAGAEIPRQPDIEAVTDIFYGRLGQRASAIRGVERFPNASLAHVSSTRGIYPQRYWNPDSVFETIRISVPDARERLGELLEQAVTRTVSGNDAVSLSGGLDSPTVARFAAERHMELSGRPLRALSTIYPDHPSVDESYYIELVAKELGLELHTYEQESSPLDDLPFWVDALDGPWDTIAIQDAAEGYNLARELGIRRMLTGEMAEAIATIGGPLFGHLLLHGRVAAAASYIKWARHRRKSPRAIAREIAPTLVPSALATRYLRMRHAHFMARALAPIPTWVSPDEYSGLITRTDYTLPIRQRWRQRQVAPIAAYVGPSAEADELGAARLGVEVRIPFADVDLAEFFLGLPAEVKFPDHSTVTKRLIKDTMRGRLPDELLNRGGKTYFDEHIADTVDWEALRGWVTDSEFRLRGIDYEQLVSDIDRRALSVNHIVWAYDLARVHAFVGLWE